MPTKTEDYSEEGFKELEKEYTKEYNKLIFAAVVGTLGFATLWVGVNFWCALGVLLAMWANNISSSIKLK